MVGALVAISLGVGEWWHKNEEFHCMDEVEGL
jgi:hypothetical protein